MKKAYLLIIFFAVICSLLFTSCPLNQSWSASRAIEIRTTLINTNIIGIAGEPADEPYIEIKYSAADEENPGHNKTVSIMVSPPYIFQNDAVYITYEYYEQYDSSGTLGYDNAYLYDSQEGGAHFLRIINHSQDKPVEIFITDVFLSDYYDDGRPLFPQIQYNNVPVFYLLFPFNKPNGGSSMFEAWSADEVAALYRAEYSRSNEVKLLYGNHRLINLIGNKPEGTEFRGSIYYGTIEPGKTLQGNESIWLIINPVL